MLQSFKDLRALPGALWILCASIVVNRMGTMVLPLLSLYVTRGLGLPAGTAGIVMSTYGAVALVVAPLAGRLSDSLGYARTMRWSLYLSTIPMLMFPFATSLPELMVAAVLLAVTTEAYRPASQAVVSRMVTGAQRRSAVALVRLAVNLGMSVGPLIGGMLADWSFTAVFVVDAMSTLLAAAALTLFFRPVLVEEPEHAATAGDAELQRAHRGAFAWFLGATVLVACVFFQLDASVPIFVVEDLHLTMSTYGFLFTLNTAIIVTMEVPLIARTAAWPHRLTLALGAGFMALGFGSMAFATSVPLLLGTVVLWTVGEMLLFPGGQAYVAELAPPARRGAWMGMYGMAFNVGFALGPLGGTAILQAHGSRTLWAVCGAVGMASAAMMALVRSPGRQWPPPPR